MAKRLFTSESVTEGHPDKVCDQISDAVLDAIIEMCIRDSSGCVPAFAHRQTPVLGGRIATAQNGRVSDYSGCVPAFAHRQTPVLGGRIATA